MGGEKFMAAQDMKNSGASLVLRGHFHVNLSVGEALVCDGSVPFESAKITKSLTP